MFLFTGQGMLTILVIALLLFGPDKLPQIGRVVGRFMAEFKRAQETVEATLKAEMYPASDNAGAEAAATAATETSAVSVTEVEMDDEEEDEE